MTEDQPRDAFVSVHSGAFQVYDKPLEDSMSSLIAGILGRPEIYCFAGDWRGVQYLLPDRKSSNAADAVVEMFDASSMRCEALTTFGKLMTAIPTGQIAKAVGVTEFDRWRADHDVPALSPGTCVPPERYAFLGGNGQLSNHPISAQVHVGLAAKLRWKMQQLGLKPGDQLPTDFFQV
ncbi:hypothetical protein GPX89_30765 [Nocardia sp. ET3-3]|uniref:Uncharacterized protein n=1 Tax=Nocardia terrae TaxID=2675851 RepID=A0A7K1V4N1_9NOCA|nr:hypothetical protein [Nocardia terrae]MVU81610.1 hypothetical protein [Nocardia terrae]